MYPPYDLMLTWDNMRLLGHPGSDLDETWWKLFPGVSRSFLNSSGTKITTKNKKNENQNLRWDHRGVHDLQILSWEICRRTSLGCATFRECEDGKACRQGLSTGRAIGGFPTKENKKIDRMNKIIYPPYDLILNFDFHFFVFLAVILVPELFKKLRETPGNNFHQVSSKSDKFRPRIRGEFYHIFPAKNLEIMYPPPPMISCIQDPPGSLPVDSYKFGHNSSDLHETWWKLIPGVSRSFLNSSGTKITAKNTKKVKIKI